MPDKMAIFEAIAGYLKQHPEELLHAVRSAAGLRISVPIASLMWLAAQAKGKRAPKDVQLEAAEPGLRASATVVAMGTPVRASAVISVERIDLNATELRFELKLSQVALDVLDENSVSPLAGLLKSGSLDLSKPGNLIGFMPKRPRILVSAEDDRIVLDLKKLKKLDDPKIERILAALIPIVTIKSIDTEPGHVNIALSAFPDGLTEAVNALKRALDRR